MFVVFRFKYTFVGAVRRMSRIFDAPRKLILRITNINTKIRNTTPSTTTIGILNMNINFSINAM